MIKEELIAYVKEVIPGKGYSGSVHDEVVSRAISTAVNSMFWEAFKDAPENLDQYSRLYEDVAVSGDFAILPVSSIQTKERMNGVRVVTSEGEGVEFIPTTDGQNRLINGSTSGVVNTAVRYAVRHDKVQFYNLPQGVDEVNMWIVRPFHLWDDEEEFPVPQGWDAFLVNKVLETLQGARIVEKTNDNNPNTI